MQKIGNYIIKYLFFILLLAISFSEISIKSQVDRYEIGINETLVLTIIISGERDVPNINLSELPDFNVVGTSKMSNVSIINGQISKSQESSYTLVPKREGDLSIPALSINIGGNKYSTQAIKIKILSKNFSFYFFY